MAHGSSARHLALVVFVLFGGFVYVTWRIRQGEQTGTPTNATLLITQTTPDDRINAVPQPGDLPSNQDGIRTRDNTLLTELLAHVPGHGGHGDMDEGLTPMIGGRTPNDGLAPVVSGEELVGAHRLDDALLPPPPPNVSVSTPAPGSRTPTATTSLQRMDLHQNEVEYVVQRGDTLLSIANRFLGSPEHATRLFEHNQDVLEAPHQLPVGVRLRIPTPSRAGDRDARRLTVDRGDRVDGTRRHTVQAGETLLSLAVRFYGTESAAETIRTANPAIRDGRLREGMVLLLPARDPDRDLPAPAQPATYTVQRGDTLSAIARKFYGPDAGWRPLYEANRDRMASPDSLRAGMVLQIPPRD